MAAKAYPGTQIYHGQAISLLNFSRRPSSAIRGEKAYKQDSHWKTSDIKQPRRSITAQRITSLPLELAGEKRPATCPPLAQRLAHPTVPPSVPPSLGAANTAVVLPFGCRCSTPRRVAQHGARGMTECRLPAKCWCNAIVLR